LEAEDFLSNKLIKIEKDVKVDIFPENEEIEI
jgi:hypothetical protein